MLCFDTCDHGPGTAHVVNRDFILDTSVQGPWTQVPSFSSVKLSYVMLFMNILVSDIVMFVLKRDVKLQLTDS